MNRVKTVIGSLAVAVMTAPSLALAQFQAPSGTNLPSASLTDIITSIMNWLLMIVGIIGVIGFVISGIMYLTAAGDENRIGTAKKAMINSIIGRITSYNVCYTKLLR